MARLLTRKTIRIWNRIVAKAWDDPNFKKSLLKDPAGCLRDHGIEVPKLLRVRVSEDAREASVTFHLPAAPDRREMRTLDDEGPITMTWSTW